MRRLLITAIAQLNPEELNPRELNPEEPYELHPQVSLRPERFGALAYHFGNRKLSFVKNVDLLRVLERLDQEPSVDAALDAAAIDRSRRPGFIKALETLEESEMVRART